MKSWAWSGRRAARPATVEAYVPVTGWVKRIAVLVETALTGLPRMLDPSTGIFAFTVRPTGPAGYSPRYTCIALIGLTAASRAGFETRLDLERLVRGVAERRREISNPGELGLLLWCLSDYHEELTPAHDELVARIPSTPSRLSGLTSTELGWLLSGLSRTAHVAPGREDIADKAHAVFAALRANYSAGTGLFCYGGRAGDTVRRRLRRELGFFDNQVYGIHGNADYHRTFGVPEALTMADRCVDQILAAQGPFGQWAWHYNVRTGTVVDRYPVYAVHQHGMAPMAIQALAEITGRSFDDALEKSVGWVFGENELGRDLVEPDHGLIWRSVRRRVAHGKLVHVFKALSLARLQRTGNGLAALVNTPRHLDVDMECRPYELGWLLLAFARR
jgi:hypothetical protein